MVSVTLARHAMATRFEIVLHGESRSHLQAAGEEALDEIQRLDTQLSLYNPASDISRLNSEASQRPVRVEPRIFQLISKARELSRLTGGAFDPTVGPLMRCWGFTGSGGQIPDPTALDQARSLCGSHHLLLEGDRCTIAYDIPGMVLDLGAIGKGYALDCAADILREAGIRHAILHGGTSTVVTIGPGPGAAPWWIGIEKPPTGGEPEILTKIALGDASLSVSAIWGKSFQKGAADYGHVIDPRSGRPVQNALLAAVVSTSATETDALSTALLVAGLEAEPILREKCGCEKGLLILPASGQPGWEIHSWGL